MEYSGSCAIALGLRGRLPMYISSFMKDKTIRVRVEQSYSTISVLEDSVLQNNVLSVTLFGITINGIAKHLSINPNFHASHSVDDLQIPFPPHRSTTVPANVTEVHRQDTMLFHLEWGQVFCVQSKGSAFY